MDSELRAPANVTASEQPRAAGEAPAIAPAAPVEDMEPPPAIAPPAPVEGMHMEAIECHCPLCMDFMFDPVTAECGQHNFCKSCYQRLFKEAPPWKCPCCRERLTDRHLGTNLLLATLLQYSFPAEYVAARQRHLPPVAIPALVPAPAPAPGEVMELSSDTLSDDSDDSDDADNDQPPPAPPAVPLGNANDSGVAAAAEELFQGAPGEEPPAPPESPGLGQVRRAASAWLSGAPLAGMLEPRAFHPNVVLQNRRRPRADSDSSDEELRALRRDHPQYSRRQLRQLRAAIQQNQRRRLA